MKNNLNLIVGLIIVIVFGVLIYFITTKEKAPIDNVPEVVVQDSALGCYVAKLSKDVYVLNIQSENNGIVSGMLAFNNYEKDSSSGSFEGEYSNGILLGNYRFNSEGMDSDMQVIFKKEGDTFVRGYGDVNTEGDKVTFKNLDGIIYDTNSTFIKSVDCIEEFSEVNNKFTLEHNSFFKAYQPSQVQTPSTDWKINAKQKGILLARISIPKAYMPNTNFSNAYLTIGASTDPKEIKSCTADASNGEVISGTKNISGYPFTKFVLGDAGAGNLYETTSYRGLLDGDCYVIEYTIHSTNIGNYSTEQGIKEFNKAKVQNEFETIIQSFKFLVNSD